MLLNDLINYTGKSSHNKNFSPLSQLDFNPLAFGHKHIEIIEISNMHLYVIIL